jgi:FkbM family methyltransferase
MTIAPKVLKLAQLMKKPFFARTVLKHRVAATIEHLEAISFCAPVTLIDIGANKGQFSTAVRGLRPEAVIHAFEPLPAAADRYAAVFRGDSLTHLHRFAIGAESGTSTFFVADREDSSSLLRPGSGQHEAYGVSAKEQIKVEVRPLGSVIDLAALPSPVLLKIDVQGTELDVLKGIESLEPFNFIYVELSFVVLYEGQCLFEDVRAHLAGRGFSLRGVFNQSVTLAFGPTQADCLFVRDEGGHGPDIDSGRRGER